MSELHGNPAVETVNESDWKLFRSRLPEWQETYMEKLLMEYADLVNGNEPASARFWTLEKKIRQDKYHPGVQISEIKRSRLYTNLLRLLENEVISLDDLDGFSDELRATVSWITKNR